MTEGPRRRPATGGYARGDEKQARIVEAALRQFGESGYDGASTRQIAADAGVNPPALQYYFGGKEGLYLACGAHIAERFTASLQGAYRQADLPAGAQREALRVLCDIMDAVADFMFETARVEGFSQFLARSLNNDGHGPRDEELARQVEDELHGHCARLVGLATGLPVDAAETHLRTIAVTGQLTAFLFGHEAALKRMGWADITGPRLHTLKAILRAQTVGALGTAGDAAGGSVPGRAERPVPRPRSPKRA